eukprot:372493-Rhodomonas_salina.2
MHSFSTATLLSGASPHTLHQYYTNIRAPAVLCVSDGTVGWQRFVFDFAVEGGTGQGRGVDHKHIRCQYRHFVPVGSSQYRLETSTAGCPQYCLQLCRYARLCGTCVAAKIHEFLYGNREVRVAHRLSVRAKYERTSGTKGN